MIMFVGDLHGSFVILRALIDRVLKDNGYLAGCVSRGGGKSSALKIIQVGDFGWYPYLLKEWTTLPFPVYAIEGNHEYYPMLTDFTHVTEVKPNLWYIPRGTVKNIDGYDIGFMGGAHSVDRYQRREGFDWWPEEEVTEENIKKLANKKVDILVTHVPPYNVIQRNWGKINHRSWHLPYNWVDESSRRIEKMWGDMGMPPMICGHMHGSATDGNCRVLDINELVFLKPDMPKPIDWHAVAADNKKGSE